MIARSERIGLASAFGAVAVGMALTACGSAVSDDPTTPVLSEPLAAPERSLPAADWRWESSHGLELAVPGSWTINDTDCNQTDAPSIVRAQIVVFDCATPEPTSKEIVEIFGSADAEGAQLPEGLEAYDVSVGDEPAERAEGRTEDGRFAGWLHVPRLGVVVQARVHERLTLTRVLDSALAVDVDQNGCATAREDILVRPPSTPTLVANDTRAWSVCYFGSSDVLLASSRIEGDAAARLATQLNGAVPGANPDAPERECLRTAEAPPADVMLIAEGTQDRAIVEVSFSGCTHRGLRNGRDTSRLSIDLVDSIMAPLQSGYAFSQL